MRAGSGQRNKVTRSEGITTYKRENQETGSKCWGWENGKRDARGSFVAGSVLCRTRLAIFQRD